MASLRCTLPPDSVPALVFLPAPLCCCWFCWQSPSPCDCVLSSASKMSNASSSSSMLSSLRDEPRPSVCSVALSSPPRASAAARWLLWRDCTALLTTLTTRTAEPSSCGLVGTVSVTANPHTSVSTNSDVVPTEMVVGPEFSKNQSRNKMGLNCLILDSRRVLVGTPGTHTPKAVTYHEQSRCCRFMIGHSLGRMDGCWQKNTSQIQILATF